MSVLIDWINSLSGTPALAPPTISPNGGAFISPISISVLSTNGGDDLYYTLDGSLPNTNSFHYVGPFDLTSNATVRANAFKTNFNNSVAATAQFTLRAPVEITSGAFFTNNNFLMPVSGLAGKTYYLQGTTNLVDWLTLSTNIAPSNSFYLIDPGASNFLYRFYRAVELP
jgi:hypothetical protein